MYIAHKESKAFNILAVDPNRRAREGRAPPPLCVTLVDAAAAVIKEV